MPGDVDMRALFSLPTAAWFEASFAAPTDAQRLGWPEIATGRNTLIHAPTGSGKTLAAFLAAIDRLLTSPLPERQRRCRVLYVSPMKALAYDVDRNLTAPLRGIATHADALGVPVSDITVAMRTGDTPQAERRAMLRTPPDVLITTPESLYLLLTSRAEEILGSVTTVIVDEVHAIAGTKRGAHLAISLERLAAVADDPQRIGLSATQRPISDIAAFLGGGTRLTDTWTPRDVAIVDVPGRGELDIEIVVPVEDMARPSSITDDDSSGAIPSIWPAMYPRLLDLVTSHRSTILFVNSRGLAERLAGELNRLAGHELVRAHHGSVAREQRLDIEDGLKDGSLKGVVATSTLELGIDMAAVELVVLVESPPSVASGLQRVGRAGHQVATASVAKVFPKHRGDLLETAVVSRRMLRGEIEETRIPRNPLDVLAQQIVAIVSRRDVTVDELHDLIRGAAPFRDLSRAALEAVLDMLSGRYPSDDFAELRPRIVWDRTADTLSPRANARILAVTNPGTIPDRGLYRVTLPEGGRVGELDEEMVYESRPGDTFILGSSSWRIQEITRDTVVVSPAPPSGGSRMPFWHGDGPGRPSELGRAIGVFVREVSAMPPDEAIATLMSEYHLDESAARNLASFMADEREATGTVPSDRRVVIERFKDEIGDWRLVLLSPFGSRIHAPWALAARRRYRDEGAGTVDMLWSDDGIVLRFPDTDTPPDPGLFEIDAAHVEEAVIREVSDSALFASVFREAAARSLLLPRRRPGSRTPLWLQRRRASDLLEVTRRFGSFPVMLETHREILQDRFDLPGLTDLLGDIAARRTAIDVVDLEGPSPFARSLMFDFVASFMYDYDAPLAERRAAALTLDRELLADLLGEPEFRDLLAFDVIDEVEAELQWLAERRRARSADMLADMLADLGPLPRSALGARCDPDGAIDEWLATLVADGRIVQVRIGGSDVFAATSDVGRLRDALGVPAPLGVPKAFLDPVQDPLGDLVSRWARTHGPFTSLDAAEALGIGEAVVAGALGGLAQRGKVLEGAFTPGGTGREWLGSDVLTRLRRRSLARLRKEVEAVEGATYATFAASWQRIGERTAPDQVFDLLAGFVAPATDLLSHILPLRLTDSSRALDAALASGDLVWIGASPLGSGNGRMALYPRHAVKHLAPPPDAEPQGPIHETLVERLSSRGASFFSDLYDDVGGDPNDVLTALWDLVWLGVVTNDAVSPLRAWLRGRRSRRPTRTPSVRVPAAAGRWYLVASLHGTSPSPEERALASCTTMLGRYGVVTRAHVAAESIPGGFSGLYPVFASLENVGTARRGYFIEGAGGAQFGLPGAIDALRAAAPSGEFVVVSASDPCQPYGSVLPWPSSPGTPRRAPGTTVALRDGAPVAMLDGARRRLVTFTTDLEELTAAAAALAERSDRVAIDTVDGESVFTTPVAGALESAGFSRGYRGLTPPARHDRSTR